VRSRHALAREHGLQRRQQRQHLVAGRWVTVVAQAEPVERADADERLGRLGVAARAPQEVREVVEGAHGGLGGDHRRHLLGHVEHVVQADADRPPLVLDRVAGLRAVDVRREGSDAVAAGVVEDDSR
jgi:hypothetical protein